MNSISILEELYLYTDWANGRIFDLCQGLDDSQWDQPREMGMGSLRATLFHVWAADQIWLERWKGMPVRPFPMDPEGISLEELKHRFATTSEARRTFLREEGGDLARRIVYRDLQGNEHRNPLGELAFHVANHAVHHRAQSLNFLKQFNRTVPGGLDYIFYKIARPTLQQDEASANALRQFGLEIASGPGSNPQWDQVQVERFFQYHDWANQQVLDCASGLEEDLTDRTFDMGLHSIRATLLHLMDAERWWLQNWGHPKPWSETQRMLPMSDIRGHWADIASARNAFIEQLDAGSADRVVTVSSLGPWIRVRVIESLLQLYCHGTHHRAQVLNMLRHAGAKPPAIDYVRWVRANGSD